MRVFLVLMFLTLMLSDEVYSVEEVIGSTLEIVELSKGGFSSRSRNASKRFVVIRSQEEFEKEFTSYTGKQAEKLDFYSGVVLLASYGSASSTGYSIEIVRVEEFEKYSKASVVLKIPVNCPVGWSVTYPYHFVYVKGRSPVLVTETLSESC